MNYKRYNLLQPTGDFINLGKTYLDNTKFKFLEDMQGFQGTQSGLFFGSGISSFRLNESVNVVGSRDIVASRITDEELVFAINEALSRNQDYICYDLELSAFKTDITNHSELTVDAYLNEFESLYNRTKAINSGLKVSFWALGAIRNYFGPTGNLNNLTNYNNWVNAFTRLNKRYDGDGGYTDRPLNQYNDIFVIPTFSYYGNSDATRYYNFVNESLALVSGNFGADKEIYTFTNYWFHPSTAWIGKIKSWELININLSGSRRYGHGMILWDSASYIAGFRYFFSPSVNLGDVSAWNTINNGGFRITISNIPVNVTGLNFTSCTNMNQVAGVINTGIQNHTSLFTVNTGINQTNTYLCPWLLGPVNFSWDNAAKRFIVINTASSGNISGFFKPPECGNRTVLSFGSPSVGGYTTNLFTGGYLYGSGQSLDYNNDNTSYFWNRYVEQQQGFNNYLNAAYADISGINNPFVDNSGINMFLSVSTDTQDAFNLFIAGYGENPTFITSADPNNLTLKALKANRALNTL
jgi:hypothetical protein